MFKFDLEDFFPTWFSKKTSFFDEDFFKNRLSDVKSVTKEYKEGDTTIKNTIYEGDGFSYSITTRSYEPSEKDLKIYQLQGELDKAVEESRYEDAAKLRDDIKSLKENKTTKDNE